MELPERVLRQESGGTAGRVDLKSPHAGEIRGPLEGPRIQRTDMAVDPAGDHGVVGRCTDEGPPREEPSLGAFRLVPNDSADPSAAGGRSRRPSEPDARVVGAAG